MKTMVTACPRDCQDCCSILATVDDTGRLVRVTGDPHHPMTRGYLCAKGLSYQELVYHPKRLRHPLRKNKRGWERISWDEALDFLVETIQDITIKHGPQSILHYHYSGSESITKKITQRFFGALGSTGVQGDLCMSGGVAAQIYDLGGLEQSEAADLLQAKGCVIWGRNIPTTNLHLLPFLKEAQARGMEILVINPLSTGLEKMATAIIRPCPGTDAALALGACRELITTGRMDDDFIEKHVYGFTEFAINTQDYSPKKVAALTGVTEREIQRLASFYVEKAPVTTLLGYGLQRYRNGGSSIRAIDALAAVSGNIGKKGAGVSYCSDTFWPIHEHIQGVKKHGRFFSQTHLAQEIRAASPPVQLAVIHAANPMVNVPDPKGLQRALQGIEHVVVTDLFMTDTAQEGDLVLPCTTFLEEEAVRLSSWSPWIFYCPPVIAPVGEARSDEEVILELARRLQVQEVPWRSKEELLQWAVQPLGFPLQELKKGHRRCPQAPTTAWKEKNFRTESGKIELYSKRAIADGQSPTAVFLPSEKEDLPLHLISPHSPLRIHSQFQMIERIHSKNPYPQAVLHPETAKTYGVKEGEKIDIYNEKGRLTVRATLSLEMRQDVVRLDSGWGQDSGGCASNLIPPKTTEMGACAALYDVRVQIRRAEYMGREKGERRMKKKR